MARTEKKNVVPTIDEKLQTAIVPDVEQPFTIPNDWQWCYLQYISQIKTGKKDANYGSENGRYLFFTCAAEPIKCNDYSFEGKAILLAGNGDIGNISLYDGKFEAYQRTYVLTIVEPISTEYLYYYFKYRWVDYNTDKMFGTAIPYIRLGNLQNFPVPLSSVAEQQRIVDRIESLFAKLDEAKEKAQAVVDGFEDRKAAILHRAFTGELTEKWRKDNRISKDSWKEESLENVCTSIFDGDHMPPPKAAAGVPFLVISNVNTGHLSFENTRFVPEEYYDSLPNTRKPNYGDVLYTLVGSYGIPVVVDDNRPFCFQRHMALLKPCNINSYYLWYQLQTQQFFDKATSIATGTAQLTVPIKGLRKLKILLVSDEEQAEIVRLLNVLLEKEERTKEIAEQTISTINIARKSILARAFRGELGTNDPNDESALELLKKVLSMEPTPQPRKKGVTLPKEISVELKTELERKILKLFIQKETDSLPVKELMSVSSKPFDVLETLHDLEKRQIIKRAENNSNTYELMR